MQSHTYTYQELLNFRNLNPDESDSIELPAWLADLLLNASVGRCDEKPSKVFFCCTCFAVGTDECSRGYTRTERNTKILAIVAVDCGT